MSVGVVVAGQGAGQSERGWWRVASMARACDRPDSSRNESERTDARSSAPTRSSRVRYKTRPAVGGAA
jgi:hypothetical protein